MPQKLLETPQGMIDIGHGPLILLFYDGYELRAMPGAFGMFYANARRFARYAKRSLCRQQVRTGFYTAFLGLVGSLRHVGCDVRVNRFDLARKYPHYPIGIGGYPSVIGKIHLPNPRIFGPGDFGMPDACAHVAQDARFKTLIQPSNWFCDIYRPFCGDKMFTWFAGIDSDTWPDYSRETKDTDFIVYDKLRWHRNIQVPTILERTLRYLESKGHSYTVLRYGHHHHLQFKQALKRSRALLFLCEHETQGLAYQEALSANIPVLAWDEGVLVDPMLQPFVKPGIAVSSVPYFNEQCGMTFTIAEFETVCADFWQQLHSFAPRRYVQEHLSLVLSGTSYLNEYARIAYTLS